MDSTGKHGGPNRSRRSTSSASTGLAASHCRAVCSRHASTRHPWAAAAALSRSGTGAPRSHRQASPSARAPSARGLPGCTPPGAQGKVRSSAEQAAACAHCRTLSARAPSARGPPGCMPPGLDAAGRWMCDQAMDACLRVRVPSRVQAAWQGVRHLHTASSRAITARAVHHLCSRRQPAPCTCLPSQHETHSGGRWATTQLP